MIQLGEDKYKTFLTRMWKLCFPSDSDAFIRFYFEKVYKNEETLILLEGDIPVASLQMIPYPVKIGASISQGGYISGAMTHPDFQNKGYMGKLLNAALEMMKEKDYSCSFLIPQEEWLFNFYQKFGYIKAFPKYGSSAYHPSLNRDKAALPAINISAKSDEINLDIFFIVYSGFLQEKTNAILKTKPQVLNILSDFFDEKGILFYNTEGVAFSVRKENKIIIKEFFYTCDTVKKEFLERIADYHHSNEIIVLNDPLSGSSHNLGMIKSLNESDVPTDIYMSMMLN